MRYITRQMLAIQPIARLEGCAYSPGDYFVASEADARYLTKHGKAVEVPRVAAPRSSEPAPEPAPEPILEPIPQLVPPARRRGRPPRNPA